MHINYDHLSNQQEYALIKLIQDDRSKLEIEPSKLRINQSIKQNNIELNFNDYHDNILEFEYKNLKTDQQNELSISVSSSKTGNYFLGDLQRA